MSVDSYTPLASTAHLLDITTPAVPAARNRHRLLLTAAAAAAGTGVVAAMTLLGGSDSAGTGLGG